MTVQRDFGDRSNRKHARLKIHDCRPRTRLVPSRIEPPARLGTGAPAAPTGSIIAATAMAGSRGPRMLAPHLAREEWPDRRCAGLPADDRAA